jgi:hypothetical protein
MLLETIVAATCIQGPGCSQATSAYYKQSAELQQIVHNVENYSNHVASQYPTTVVYVLTPLYTLTISRSASFKIYKTLMFEVNVKNETLALKWSY